MGHSFGLPHSGGQYDYPYDSTWDVMSAYPLYSCTDGPDPTYGPKPMHTISYHKDLLDWIPGSRILEPSLPTQTITLTQLSQPPPGGYLMVRIPIGGSTTHFYTVEARRQIGYDEALCGDAVTIHEVDTTRIRRAQVIDIDGNGDPNDDGAMWTAGETFTDTANEIAVKVLSSSSTGFSLQIDIGAALGDTPVTSWLSPVDLVADRGNFYTFTAGYLDGNGATDLQYAELLINKSFDPSGACYVRYNQSSGEMQIHNGAFWLNAGVPGSGTIVSRPLCDLDAGGSSVSPLGNALTVGFAIRFSNSASGTLNAYLQAIDYGGRSSGGNDHGDVTIGAWTLNTDLDVDTVYAEGLPPSAPMSFQIFDSPGGASLYGPVTRDAQSQGTAYLFLYEHGVDLVPGLYVVATDLSTGVERQLEIAELYIDDIDELNDVVSGRAPPGSSVRISVRGFWTSNEVTVTTDSGGNWQADFSVRGFDVTGGAYLTAKTSDADGDTTVTSGWTSNIEVSLSEDSIRANSIAVGGSVRYQIFESKGGPSLYGPVTRQIGSFRSYDTLSRSQHGIDLVPGNYVVMTDLATGTLRDLVLADLSIISVDVENDTVSGTGPASETVGVWVRSLNQGYGASTTAAGDGSWAVDFSSFADITSAMIVEAEVANAGGNQTTLTADLGPQTLAVTPNNATVTAGTEQIFAAEYTDVNGRDDVHSAYFLINGSFTSVGACYVSYGQNSNSLWLHDGSTWLSAGSPGSGSVVSGPRCDLDPSASTVSGSGNILTVYFALAFDSSFSGSYNLFLRAVDDGNHWSSPTDHGNLTIQAANIAPTTVSVAPSTVSLDNFDERIFSAVYSDADGWDDLTVVFLSLSSTSNPIGECVVRYDRRSNQLAVLGDLGDTSWNVIGPPGTGIAFRGRNCILNPVATSVSNDGANRLTVDFAIRPAFPPPGPYAVRLGATDAAGSLPPYTTHGTLTVNNKAPTTVAITPNNATVVAGTEQVLAATYSDGDGWADLKSLYLKIASSSGSCTAAYNQNSNTLWLLDGSWQNAGAPGSSSTVAGSSCTLDASASSTSNNGFNSLTASFALTFADGFAGTYDLIMYVYDESGAVSSVTDRGNLTVTADAAPTTTSVSPNSATVSSGAQQIFAAAYTDANGYADIKHVFLLINSAVSGSGACYVHYNEDTNRMAVRSGSSWKFTSTGPGSGSAVSSAQCSLDPAASSVSRSGNDLTVNYAITFTGAMAGTQNLYL